MCIHLVMDFHPGQAKTINPPRISKLEKLPRAANISEGEICSKPSIDRPTKICTMGNLPISCITFPSTKRKIHSKFSRKKPCYVSKTIQSYRNHLVGFLYHSAAGPLEWLANNHDELELDNSIAKRLTGQECQQKNARVCEGKCMHRRGKQQ